LPHDRGAGPRAVGMGLVPGLGGRGVFAPESSVNRLQDFQLVEIVIEHTSVIPDADTANIHAYLKAKYAL
jgi:hypothetical protein